MGALAPLLLEERVLPGWMRLVAPVTPVAGPRPEVTCAIGIPRQRTLASPLLCLSREVEEGAEGRRERAAWTPHVSFTARGYELLTAGLGPVAPGN